MNDAAVMSELDGTGQRLDQFGGAVGRPGGAVELLCQAAARAVLQGQVRSAVVFADGMDLHDVGMLEVRRCLGLPAEALSKLGPLHVLDKLQSDLAVEAWLAGPVHHPHAATADFLQNFIARHGGRPATRAARSSA